MRALIDHSESFVDDIGYASVVAALLAPVESGELGEEVEPQTDYDFELEPEPDTSAASGGGASATVDPLLVVDGTGKVLLFIQRRPVKVSEFALIMMDFVLKVMDCVLKMMNFGRTGWVMPVRSM